MIYFLGLRPDGPIKIGVTRSLARRLQSHRGYWPQSVLLGVHEGDEVVEDLIHRRFDHLRLPSRHRSGAGCRPERFHPDPDLLEYIQDFCWMPPAEDIKTPGQIEAESDHDVHRMLREMARQDGVSLAAFARDTVCRVVREEFARRGMKLLQPQEVP